MSRLSLRIGISFAVLVSPPLVLAGILIRSNDERLAIAEGRIRTFEQSLPSQDWNTGGRDDCRVQEVVHHMPSGGYGTERAREVARRARGCASSWNVTACGERVCDQASIVLARRGLPLLDAAPSDTGCVEAAADAIALVYAMAPGTRQQGIADEVERAMTTLVTCPVPDAGAHARARETLTGVLARPAPPVSGFVDRAIASDVRFTVDRARNDGLASRTLFAAGATAYLDALLELSAGVHACERSLRPDCAAEAVRLEAVAMRQCLGSSCGSSVAFAAWETDALRSSIRASVVLLDAIAQHAETGAWRDPPSAADPALASTWRGVPPAIDSSHPPTLLFTWTTPASYGAVREQVWLPRER